MADDPALDGEDIQGNIFPGFHRKQQLHLGYAAPSEAILRAALKVLAPQITHLVTVLGHKDDRKQALMAETPPPERDDLWVNIALGAAALDRLGETAIRKLDEAFDIGMRPSRTGDPWRSTDAQGNPNPAHPSNWSVGNPSHPLDLLVIVAFDDPAVAGVDAFVASLTATGLQEIYREPGARLTGNAEHFGFADGISEVGIRGTVTIDGEARQITTRYGVPARDGMEFGKPAQPLVWPGQFLVGTATGPGTNDGAPARYKNGSFLVFRRLSQDVRAFVTDTEAIAQTLSTPAAPVGADQLQASIIGRWPSGNALMRHATDVPAMDDILSINYFAFGDPSPDLQLATGPVAGSDVDAAPIRGLRCPAFAHVRKVNPRDLPTDKGDRDQTRSFQMLRRGVPFGPAYDRANPANPINGMPRGLLFFAYQRAPSQQFDQLNRDWMNTDSGPTPGGFDLLVGQNVAPDTGLYLAKTATRYLAPNPAPGAPVVAMENWVKPSGGAYLFAPSLKHIQSLAEPAPAITVGHLFTAKLTMDAPLLVPNGLPQLDAVNLRHDGKTRISTLTGRESLVEANWPTTALLPAGASVLSGPHLHSLDLSGEHFPVDTLEPSEAGALAASDSLETIQMDGTGLNGVSLTALARRLTELKQLNLAGCDIEDADLAMLSDARASLTSLAIGLAKPRNGHRFTAPRLTGASIQHLERFPHLRELSLRGVSLVDDTIVNSDLWQRLDTVDLGETAIGDKAAKHLANPGLLRNISLDQTNLGDAGAAAIAARPLEALSLSWTRVGMGALGALATDNLRALQLAGLAIDDGFAPTIARMTALRSIDLSQTQVGDLVAAALVELPNLDDVNVAGTAITAAGLAALAAANVRSLDATALPANADVLKHLANSSSLEAIALSVGADWTGLDAISSEVRIEGRAPIAGMPPARLSDLTMQGELTSSCSANLSNLAALRALAIFGSVQKAQFESGFEALHDFRAERAGLSDANFSALLALPSIEALYISGNPVAGSFGNWHGDHIHTIELRGTNIDDKAAAFIAALPRLHCLDVPETLVTSAGIVTLAENAINLQSLAVDGRQVDAASAKALAAHDRLSELYLYGADVKLETLRALAAIRLREITLVNTGLTDAAVPIIAGFPALRRLSVGRELSGAGVASLKALRPDLTIYWDALPRASSNRP